MRSFISSGMDRIFLFKFRHKKRRWDDEICTRIIEIYNLVRNSSEIMQSIVTTMHIVLKTSKISTLELHLSDGTLMMTIIV